MKCGKKLGGIGRLNEKFINRLQNYYGLAIRQNTDSLINVRKAVGAVLYPCSEAATPEARHMFCDKDSEWCKYRIAEKKGELYVEKTGFANCCSKCYLSYLSGLVIRGTTEEMFSWRNPK